MRDSTFVTEGSKKRLTVAATDTAALSCRRPGPSAITLRLETLTLETEMFSLDAYSWAMPWPKRDNPAAVDTDAESTTNVIAREATSEGGRGGGETTGEEGGEDGGG